MHPLENIKIYKFRFNFLVVKPMILPRFPGATIKEILGEALKNTDKELFNLLFSPYKKTNNTLKPYALQMPANIPLAYMPDDIFSFDMIITGNAIEKFNNFEPFEYIKNIDIGEHKGKMYFVNAQNIISDDKILNITNFKEAEAFVFTHKKIKTDIFLLRFISPVNIDGINIIKQINFSKIINNLNKRIIGFNNYFQEENAFNTELYEQAKKIKTIENKLIRYDIKQCKTNNNFNTVYKPVFIGIMAFVGNPAPFVPLLQIGEQINIGRDTTSAFGQFKTEYIT